MASPDPSSDKRKKSIWTWLGPVLAVVGIIVFGALIALGYYYYSRGNNEPFIPITMVYNKIATNKFREYMIEKIGEKCKTHPTLTNNFIETQFDQLLDIINRLDEVKDAFSNYKELEILRVHPAELKHKGISIPGNVHATIRNMSDSLVKRVAEAVIYLDAVYLAEGQHKCEMLYSEI